MLYLMLCRTSRKQELLLALKARLAKTDETWNTIIRCLQPVSDEDMSSERANAFLPYTNILVSMSLPTTGWQSYGSIFPALMCSRISSIWLAYTC